MAGISRRALQIPTKSRNQTMKISSHARYGAVAEKITRKSATRFVSSRLRRASAASRSTRRSATAPRSAPRA